MSIRDRDYMKRPSDDDGSDGSSTESRAEEFAQRILKKYSRLFICGGIALALLIVAALIIVSFSHGPH